ncbi:MAG: phosphatase PAP2 family protein [Bacteroidia bacterium]
MTGVLEQWDIAMFHTLNSLHAYWLDPVMYLISTRWVWIPLYALILIVIFRREGWRGLGWLLTCWLVMILISDQTASGLLKPLVERYRPCRPEAGLPFDVHTVYGDCGGLYGFASSHAANFFAMATFFSLVFRRKQITVAAFLLAIITGYSRIYLGVHYPGDIFAGAVIGIVVGWGMYSIYKMGKIKFPPIEDQRDISN